MIVILFSQLCTQHNYTVLLFLITPWYKGQTWDFLLYLLVLCILLMPQIIWFEEESLNLQSSYFLEERPRCVALTSVRFMIHLPHSPGLLHPKYALSRLVILFNSRDFLSHTQLSMLYLFATEMPVEVFVVIFYYFSFDLLICSDFIKLSDLPWILWIAYKHNILVIINVTSKILKKRLFH